MFRQRGVRNHLALAWTLVLIAACSSVTGSAGPSRTRGGSGPAGEPSPRGPATGEAPSEEAPSGEAPSDEGLRQIDFDGPDEGAIGGVAVVRRRGTIELATGGGEVLVTIAGRSPDALDLFAREAKFRFDRGAVVKPDQESPVDRNDVLSQDRIAAEPDNESILVTFQLTEPTAKELPIGSLTATIDPTVKPGMYNNFSALDTSTDYAKVTVNVDRGQVEVKLYRRCSTLATATAAPPATTNTTLTGYGAGYFDLSVRGQASANSYRVRGTWNYDYDRLLASSPEPSLPCASSN